MTRSTQLPFIRPAEPTLARAPPQGDTWSHELKWDGWRLQITKDETGIWLRTRTGRLLDLPRLTQTLARLPAKSFIIDAELVACDPQGRCDLAKLRQALARKTENALVMRGFDIMHLDGQDVREKPLRHRQKLLAGLIKKARIKQLLMSEGLIGDPQAILAFAETHRLEGIVSKKREAPYRSGKTRAWVKCKTEHWRRTRTPQILKAKGKRARSWGGDGPGTRLSWLKTTIPQSRPQRPASRITI